MSKVKIDDYRPKIFHRKLISKLLNKLINYTRSNYNSLPSSLRFAGYKVPFRTELGQDQIIRCYYYKVDIGGFTYGKYFFLKGKTILQDPRSQYIYIYVVQSTNK
ncbi:unnamed protein product, partial [Musa acuminata var. zebrina]